MRFPNAYKGVKKIFTSEVLNIIAIILMAAARLSGLLTPAVSTAADGSADIDGTAALLGLGFMGLFSIAGLILMVIAYVIMIVGISNAKNDDDAFKTAMLFVYVELICIAASSISSLGSLATSLFNMIAGVAGFAVTLFIIQGIRNLADRLNRGDISAKGANIFKAVAVMYIITILASIVGIFAPLIADHLRFAADLIKIVIYVAFLSYLSQAKKMLNS